MREFLKTPIGLFLLVWALTSVSVVLYGLLSRYDII